MHEIKTRAFESNRQSARIYYARRLIAIGKPIPQRAQTRTESGTKIL
jgi:hypothetical protein